MLFHTWTFVFFFLIFYPVYLALRKTRAGTPWLLLASYVFYAAWSTSYLLLIFWSTTVDYLAVVAMARVPMMEGPWISTFTPGSGSPSSSVTVPVNLPSRTDWARATLTWRKATDSRRTKVVERIFFVMS